LQRVNDELGALTVQLHTSKEEERRQIVQELHDGVGQLLTAAKINLQIAGREPTPGAGQRKIDEAVQLIDQGIDGVRNLSRGMRPAMLDEAGLVVALQTFLDGQRRLSGLELTLRADPQLRRLPPST